MDYKIVCTNQVPVNLPTIHAHIIAVGVDTNRDGFADEKHEKEQVIRNIRGGMCRYYTVGSRTGKVAFVEIVYCAFCKSEVIRSAPDATTDNNLDSLRRCNWT